MKEKKITKSTTMSRKLKIFRSIVAIRQNTEKEIVKDREKRIGKEKAEIAESNISKCGKTKLKNYTITPSLSFYPSPFLLNTISLEYSFIQFITHTFPCPLLFAFFVIEIYFGGNKYDASASA